MPNSVIEGVTCFVSVEIFHYYYYYLFLSHVHKHLNNEILKSGAPT